MPTKKMNLMAILITFGLCVACPLFSTTLNPQTPVTIFMDCLVNSVNVAGNPSGFVATWKDDENSEASASFSSDNGQTWSLPARFGADVGSLVTVSAQNSKFLASWVQSGDMAGGVFTSVSLDGKSWNMPVSIVMTDPEGNEYVTTAATNVGFMAVWTQRVMGDNAVRTSFSTDGSSWGSPVDLPAMDEPNENTVSIAGNANGFLATFTAENGDLAGYASFSSDQGATWSTPVEVGELDGGILAVGANSSGFLAAWIEPDMQQIFTSFSSDNGATWGSPVAIPMSEVNTDVYLDISGNDSGFVVTWVEGFNGSANPKASLSEDNGATWNTPVSIMSSVSDEGSPNVVGVSVSTSNVLFTWKDDSDNAVSSYSTFPFSGGGDTPSPPPNSQFYKQISPNNPGRRMFD